MNLRVETIFVSPRIYIVFSLIVHPLLSLAFICDLGGVKLRKALVRLSPSRHRLKLSFALPYDYYLISRYRNIDHFVMLRRAMNYQSKSRNLYLLNYTGSLCWWYHIQHVARKIKYGQYEHRGDKKCMILNFSKSKKKIFRKSKVLLHLTMSISLIQKEARCLF